MALGTGRSGRSSCHTRCHCSLFHPAPKSPRQDTKKLALPLLTLGRGHVKLTAERPDALAAKLWLRELVLEQPQLAPDSDAYLPARLIRELRDAPEQLVLNAMRQMSEGSAKIPQLQAARLVTQHHRRLAAPAAILSVLREHAALSEAWALRMLGLQLLDHEHGAEAARVLDLKADEPLTAGFDMLQQAAHLQHATAMTALARCHELGIGTRSNLDEALAWLESAADLAEPIAAHRLAVLLGKSSEPRSTREANETQPPQRDQAVPDRIVALLCASAAKGLPEAQVELGVRAYRGLEAPTLALLALDDIGLEDSLPERIAREAPAIRLFRAAARQEHAEGHFNLGLCYQHGRGVAPNRGLAREHMLLAAELSHGPAWNQLAILEDNTPLLARVRGVSLSAKQRNHLNKALEQGCTVSGITLAWQHVMQAMGETRAVVQGPMLEFLRNSAQQQHHPRAQFLLGCCLEYGLDGEGTRDIWQALQLYESAAAGGFAEAQLRLGYAFFLGEGRPERADRAVALFRQAARQELPAAINNLGVAHYHGVGVKRDLAQAALLFVQASQDGNLAATRNLAVCMALGHGVAKDVEEAAELQRLAPHTQTHPHHGLFI
ncbi:uncharacterized protein MONBRDRAFT_26462 [Monosiga brevicollis MX1]|uniref:Sel1 repeat family protein n=1 Tax=Monosiga brevicollis TaxID=81824 RepID=A9V2F6_MONBE|nr:uncharacterized protein MONBRDRAFT_26462 [Monosiga brevicollis MX1]EDQ88249.1 predicted protein [Monosiga brevicollis MX1]|eukprot:XP_001746842.1 hypothetical protein [Monosiga brevicollis MX1]